MNFQQLEYIAAVAANRNFARAAEQCCVTQPTLSMMIKKLEEELGVIIFDRRKAPAELTPQGKDIVQRAIQILNHVKALKESALEIAEGVTGQLTLGVIPTAAPFLLPLFLKSIAEKFRQLNITVAEMMTTVLLEKITGGSIDIGIAATPLEEPGIVEIPLFHEEFLAYVPGHTSLLKKKEITAADIDPSDIWLLEDGHCLSDQASLLCNIQKENRGASGVIYNTGSVHSLIKIVESNGGVTIVPELAAREFSKEQSASLRPFVLPAPVRQISLIAAEYYPRKKILSAIASEIIKSVSPLLMNREKQKLINLRAKR